MFSGIVEAKCSVLEIQKNEPSILRIKVWNPSFSDLKIGDSICSDGVCLTVENFSESFIQFAVGTETLAITNWQERLTLNSEINLERSLKLGDRIHGHLVTGHVDGLAKVIDLRRDVEGLFFSVEIPSDFSYYTWKKGSLCLNGVSLTINEVNGNILSFYLIPETLKKTNLVNIQKNDWLHFEVDMMAKAAMRYQEKQFEHNT